MNDVGGPLVTIASIDDASPEASPSVNGRPAIENAELYAITDHFRQCREKECLLHGFRQFAGHYFETVAVFAVEARHMRLLTGDGPNLESLTMPSALVPLDGVSIIRRAIRSRMPYIGPIPAGKEERRLLRNFIRTVPDTCWIYPATIGDDVDCLIYAEAPRAMAHRCTERLEFITGKLILALRRLLIERLLAIGA